MTVGSYKPELARSVSLRRPMSVLEEEITGDIYTQGSNDEDQNEKVDAKTQISGESNSKKVLVASHLESRLPGQVSKTTLTHINIYNSWIQSSNPFSAM